jgi:hypothetical protein
VAHSVVTVEEQRSLLFFVHSASSSTPFAC